MIDYWKSFLTDVLWKTIKRAIVYAVVSGLIALVLAVIVLLLLMPAAHSVLRKTLEGGLLFSVYVTGGVASGFLLGVATLHRHVERLVDSAYQTVCAVVGISIDKLSNGTQSVSREQLSRILGSGSDRLLAQLDEKWGFVRKPWEWLMRGPLQLLLEAIAREILRQGAVRDISLNALDNLIKKELVPLVRLPLEGKLRAVRYLAIGVGLVALVLPPILMRLG